MQNLKIDSVLQQSHKSNKKYSEQDSQMCDDCIKIISNSSKLCIWLSKKFSKILIPTDIFGDHSTGAKFESCFIFAKLSLHLGSRGSMVAKLKLKGIDGRAPPGVEPVA